MNPLTFRWTSAGLRSERELDRVLSLADMLANGDAIERRGRRLRAGRVVGGAPVTAVAPRRRKRAQPKTVARRRKRAQPKRELIARELAYAIRILAGEVRDLREALADLGKQPRQGFIILATRETEGGRGVPRR